MKERNKHGLFCEIGTFNIITWCFDRNGEEKRALIALAAPPS